MRATIQTTMPVRRHQTLFLMVSLTVISLSTFVGLSQQTMYLRTCAVRSDIIHYLNHTCDEVRRVQPMCRKTIRISYTDFPPYIMDNGTGHTIGIFTGFFQKVFVDMCCLGCGSISFVRDDRSVLKRISGKNHDDVDIVAPIQNHINSLNYMGEPYISVLELFDIHIIGVLKNTEPADRMTSLFKSLVWTWPLLIMAASMVAGAGSLIWVLDLRFNKKRFSGSFPHGMLEGIWCAFVSMTTVGYGDRTPSSRGARVFAVFWIFFGITFFAMYLGTITSVMTKNLQEKPNFEISGEKIGILKRTHSPKFVIDQNNAIPEEFETVEKMVQALATKQIHGIALDKWMSAFYMGLIKRAVPEAEIQKRLEVIESGIGFVSHDPLITFVTKIFIFQNFDNLLSIWYDIAMQEILKYGREEFSNETVNDIAKDIWNIKFGTEVKGEGDALFTYKHESFPILVGTMFALLLACVFVIKCFMKQSSRPSKYLSSHPTNKMDSAHSSDRPTSSTDVSRRIKNDRCDNNE